MAMRKYFGIAFAFVLLSTGCTTVQHISKTDVNYTIVKSDASIPEDKEVVTIIAPYKLQLDAVMNEVLAVLPAELTKQKPESTLGNWVSDVIVERLRKDGYEVDFAIVNYGGLRVPYLSSGPLTRGEIYELSPFDNTLMVVEVPGHKLDSVFRLIAESEGWPISKEARLVIADKKWVSVHIAGQPMQMDKIYKLATIDYVANGGDNMSMLISLSRKQTNLLVRDVLIDYLKYATASGKQITGMVDGRISKQ